MHSLLPGSQMQGRPLSPGLWRKTRAFPGFDLSGDLRLARRTTISFIGWKHEAYAWNLNENQAGASL